MKLTNHHRIQILFYIHISTSLYQFPKHPLHQQVQIQDLQFELASEQDIQYANASAEDLQFLDI